MKGYTIFTIRYHLIVYFKRDVIGNDECACFEAYFKKRNGRRIRVFYPFIEREMSAEEAYKDFVNHAVDFIKEEAEEKVMFPSFPVFEAKIINEAIK